MLPTHTQREFRLGSSGVVKQSLFSELPPLFDVPTWGTHHTAPSALLRSYCKGCALLGWGLLLFSSHANDQLTYHLLPSGEDTCVVPYTSLEVMASRFSPNTDSKGWKGPQSRLASSACLGKLRPREGYSLSPLHPSASLMLTKFLSSSLGVKKVLVVFS